MSKKRKTPPDEEDLEASPGCSLQGETQLQRWAVEARGESANVFQVADSESWVVELLY